LQMKIDAFDHEISYGSRRIPCQLRLMPRKSLRIVVRPDLSVRADAPSKFPLSEVIDAVQSKARWISNKLDVMKEFHPLPMPHRYVSGETFVYLGRQYRLRVACGRRCPAKLRGKFLHVAVASPGDRCAIRALVEAWFRERAEDVFNRYLKQCLMVAKRHGISEPKLVIRNMRTRWGSCSSSGCVTLNLRLVQAPVHCIEYVVMHELCHLVHHDHSPQFFRLLTRCMPDWKKRRAVLSRVVIPNQPPPKA